VAASKTSLAMRTVFEVLGLESQVLGLNLELNVLNKNFSKLNDVKYDEYFSPCKLSKLASSIADKTDVFFLHFT